MKSAIYIGNPLNITLALSISPSDVPADELQGLTPKFAFPPVVASLESSIRLLGRATERMNTGAWFRLLMPVEANEFQV